MNRRYTHREFHQYEFSYDPSRRFWHRASTHRSHTQTDFLGVSACGLITEAGIERLLDIGYMHTAARQYEHTCVQSIRAWSCNFFHTGHMQKVSHPCVFAYDESHVNAMHCCNRKVCTCEASHHYVYSCDLSSRTSMISP